MKKVLSFVLILALVLGSFSFAFGLTDVDGNAMEDAIKVNADLDIIKGFPDGSFKPEQAVTRAEFAAMITRALAIPESALAAYSTTSFKDTSGYGWAVKYLAFCESKGIMIGDGYGNVMPGRTINQNEAITMVARSLGYTENAAVLVGTWPSNYVTLGKDLGLYSGLANVATVDRANAAQVIYNALTVAKVQVNSTGEVTKVVPTSTMLETLGAKYWAKDADLDNAFAVYTTKYARSSVINSRAHVGAFVKAYTNDDGEVIAVAEVGSTFLTGTFSTTDASFTANDVDYIVSKDGSGNMKTMYKDKDGTDQGALFGVNGDIDGTTLAALNKASTGAFTLAVKLVGKTITQVYSVIEWTASEAFLFEDVMLDADSLNGFAFAKDKNDEMDKSSFDVKGAASLDAIAEDSVVTVYTVDALSSGKVVRVEVGTEKVTGKITLKDGDEWTIGGKVLKKAATLVGSSDTLALGDTGTAYLNYQGRVAKWKIDDATADNYAVVTAELVQYGRDWKIKLLDKAGVEKDYTLADGTSTAFTTNATITTPGDLAVGDIVTLSVDKDGDIDKMEAKVDVTTTTTDYALNKGRTLYGSSRLDKAVVVFSYNASTLASASAFDVVSLEDIKTETVLTQTWEYSDGSSIEVLLVSEDFTGVDSTFAVMNSSLFTFNADGDKVIQLKGFAKGKEYISLTNDRTIGADFNNEFSEASTSKAIYKLSVDSKGVVTSAVATTGSSISPVNGTVEELDGSYLVKINSAWKVVDPAVVVYKYDKSDKKFSLGKITDIKQNTTASSGSAVEMYQMDSDSEIFDFIVIVQP